MDELEISGRRYISSVRAAKEHKYHSDYIGQLIRGGKVVGQKVGRAWYVDADSLAEYLGKEIPARGPAVRESKAEPIKEVGEEIVIKVQSAGSGEKSPTSAGSATDFSPEPAKEPSVVFDLPFGKSRRQHMIAAIDAGVEDKKQEAKLEVVSEITIEEEPLEPKEAEPVEDAFTEEETFIPLKITKEVREPEDSFYKVSPKSLRYVSGVAPAMQLPLKKIDAASRTPSGFGGRLVKVAGVLVVAATLSLGVGVVASYYLHSITTISNAGQSSGIILSQ